MPSPEHDVGHAAVRQCLHGSAAGTAPVSLLSMLRVRLAGQHDDGVDQWGSQLDTPALGQSLVVLLEPLSGVGEGAEQVGAGGEGAVGAAAHGWAVLEGLLQQVRRLFLLDVHHLRSVSGRHVSHGSQVGSRPCTCLPSELSCQICGLDALWPCC
jgi:hypothetical protein